LVLLFRTDWGYKCIGNIIHFGICEFSRFDKIRPAGGNRDQEKGLFSGMSNVERDIKENNQSFGQSFIK
jgi:hypothetical protein